MKINPPNWDKVERKRWEDEQVPAEREEVKDLYQIELKVRLSIFSLFRDYVQ